MSPPKLRQLLAGTLSMLLRRGGLYVTRMSGAERQYLESVAPDGTPAPPDADHVLRQDNPDLASLKQRYERFDHPAGRGRRWSLRTIRRAVDLRHFRGDGPYMWHYRELPRVTRLKYHAYLRYVLERDATGLLGKLGEDGSFGCWTFEFAGLPRVSRDLLDAVNEISFLERHLQLVGRPGGRVLDIGAGYGRLAHRLIQAQPALADYCCIDAIPESTFLCAYYLRYRGCAPPARVVPLDRVETLEPGAFDVALNVHSFSECPRAAIAWWLQRLQALHVPWLFIVPNDRDQLLSLEADGARQPFGDLVSAAGYRLVASEPTVADPAVRELVGIDDHFLLFQRTPA